jgi:hypothetical protein
MRIEARRKDRMMNTSGEMELLLERMTVGRLGVATSDGPYVVAVNYLYLEGAIYFHSAREGRKIEALQADPRVCFLVDDVGPQVLFEQDCGISQIYESVACFGRAEFVENPAEKRRILESMVQKFVPADHPLPSIGDGNVENTLVVKIVIESKSGKANRVSPSHTVLLNRQS